MTLIIVEVDDAASLAGDLFRTSFGHPIPELPRHFVAIDQSANGGERVVGYIHYTAWETEGWLCGGLCVDHQAYVRAEPTTASEWKREGGIGEIILRETFARLSHRVAIFGYCGDARQWQHDLNVGFVAAGPQHLLVKWNRALPLDEQMAMIERAAALGPF
jgi:hypothetical protein